MIKYRENIVFNLMYFESSFKLFLSFSISFIKNIFCINKNVYTHRVFYITLGSFPDSSVGKESACNAGDPSLIPRSGRSAGEGIDYPLQCFWASLVAQPVKNLPAMKETWIRSLGWEDPLVWWIPRTTVHGVTKSRIQLSDFHLHNNSRIGYWGLMK